MLPWLFFHNFWAQNGLSLNLRTCSSRTVLAWILLPVESAGVAAKMPTWVYIVFAVKNGQIVEHLKEYPDIEKALSKLRLLNRLFGMNTS